MISFNIDTSISKRIKIDATLDLPKKKKADEKSPLIIYLHGAGERGIDPKLRPLISIRNEINEKMGFAILTPYCEDDEIWEPDPIYELVRQCINFGEVDPQRIYLTGTSMGARGVWNIATTYPDIFAAIVPISGYSYYLKAAKIAKIPTLIFHGSYDKIVPFTESVKMLEAIRMYGGRAHLYDTKCGHDHLCTVYENKYLYEWLLLHKKYENIAISQ